MFQISCVWYPCVFLQNVSLENAGGRWAKWPWVCSCEWCSSASIANAFLGSWSCQNMNFLIFEIWLNGVYSSKDSRSYKTRCHSGAWCWWWDNGSRECFMGMGLEWGRLVWRRLGWSDLPLYQNEIAGAVGVPQSMIILFFSNKGFLLFLTNHDVNEFSSKSWGIKGGVNMNQHKIYLSPQQMFID